METLTVVSTIFLLWTLGNLSVVSLSFSNGKSNRYFKNFLAVHFSQFIHSVSFNFVFKWKM